MKQCKSCGHAFKPCGVQKTCSKCLNTPRICENCKVEFLPRRLSAPTRFCGRKCKSDWVGKTECCAKTCTHCGAAYKGMMRSVCCEPCRNILVNRKCKQCGVAFTVKSPNSTSEFCGHSCSSRWNMMQPEFRAKFYTKERVEKITKSRLEMYRNNPERYRQMREALSNGMEKYMASLTPEEKKVRRLNMSKILKERGHKPLIRGGNGTGPTKAESVLLAMFPEAILNYPVKTGMKAGSGYPTCYKVDLGFVKIKLGVEADGASHQLLGRKEQDEKKTNLLTALGWTVARFTNKRILEDTENVKQELLSIILRLKDTPATP